MYAKKKRKKRWKTIFSARKLKIEVIQVFRWLNPFLSCVLFFLQFNNQPNDYHPSMPSSTIHNAHSATVLAITTACSEHKLHFCSDYYYYFSHIYLHCYSPVRLVSFFSALVLLYFGRSEARAPSVGVHISFAEITERKKNIKSEKQRDDENGNHFSGFFFAINK